MCAGNPSDKPSTAQPWAKAKIAEFCNLIVKSYVTVDSDKNKYLTTGYKIADTGDHALDQLWLSVAKNPICQANTVYEINEDECNHFLGIAVDGCNTNTITEKFGGQVYGRCSVWNMTTRFGTDGTPPGGPLSRRSVRLDGSATSS